MHVNVDVSKKRNPR